MRFARVVEPGSGGIISLQATGHDLNVKRSNVHSWDHIIYGPFTRVRRTMLNRIIRSWIALALFGVP